MRGRKKKKVKTIILELLEIYIVINFKVYRISRDTRNLFRASMLIKKNKAKN